MAATVPPCPPTSFTAGDSVEFTTAPADFPPSEGWSGAFTLILSDSRVAFTVTDDGAGEFTVTLGASIIDDLTAETEARLIGTVTGSGDFDGERHVFYDAAITILPNPEKATGDGMRTTAQVELNLVNAAIASFTEGKMASYSVGGRAVQYLTIKDLYQRQAILEARIRDEKGLGFRRRLVSFVNA